MNSKKIAFLALLIGILTIASIATPGLAATTSFNQSLSVGSRGFDVIALQNFLIDAGLLKISAPTGYFGPLTKVAVQSFQRSHGIITTGYFGPLSRAAANADIQLASANVPPKSSVSVVSVSAANSNLSAVFLANSRNISWKTGEYPASAGVNINLLRKVSDSPSAYELVRQIASNTPNDGEAIWSPAVNERLSSNLYIEVTCATTVQFNDGCRVDGNPIKAL